MNIQPVTAEVASDDRLWHGMASCPCRAGSDRSQATVQVYVQGGGGPGPFTGSRPRVQTGSPPQPPYATLPTDRVIEALREAQDRIRFIQTRHEEAAAFAACAYAKWTGRLGGCLATSG